MRGDIEWLSGGYTETETEKGRGEEAETQKKTQKQRLTDSGQKTITWRHKERNACL